MAKLTNLKYELIAQGVVKGLSAEEAAVAAGLKGDRSNSWRIVRRPEVTARVAELRKRAMERTVVTIEKITEKLIAIAKKGEVAEKADLLSVARACYMDVAKLNGLVVDKTESQVSVREWLSTAN